MVYKEKDAQLEDNRSTAYTFLGVGIAGLILSFFCSGHHQITNG